jgi:hypothetical protein
VKKYLGFLAAVLLFLVGCGEDRIADIGTTDSMEEKILLFIFPSVPKELCYSDRLTESLNDLADEFNASNAQVLSVNYPVDCFDYHDFDPSLCGETEFDTKENKHIVMDECRMYPPEPLHFCFYVKGDEYKDTEGNTFEESCVAGYDFAVNP